jgi:hypothetical protein
MEKYLDAFLYIANWETRRLMIRLPARLLDLKTAQRYCVAFAAAAWRDGDHVILDLVSEDDSGDWRMTGRDGWRRSSLRAWSLDRATYGRSI